MKNKQTMIIAGIVLAVLIAAFFVFGRGNKDTSNGDTEQVLEQEEQIQKVDSSVVVSLEPGALDGEALLSIKNAPDGTESIDYEFSYDAKATNDAEAADGAQTVPQGAIGGCDEQSGGTWACGEPSANGRKIVLGTCSSGTCRYHDVVGPINVLLSFEGTYGKRVFEKSYDLNK